MTTAAFIVECPCCQAKLTVDPEVRAVIAHEEPPRKRTVADLDTAFGALGAKAAERAGTRVTGAELVGLLPAAALDAIHHGRWEELGLSADLTIESRLVRR